MGVLGALVGGGIGFMLGGPLGAILLGALGAEMGDGVRAFETTTAGGAARGRLNTGTPPFSRIEAQQVYLVALISLAAKVTKADGRVTEAEVRSFDAFLRDQLKMRADERRVAARIFNQARDSSIPAEQFARQISAIAGSDPDRLRDLIAVLLRIAMADGRLNIQEEHLIRSVCLAMGLTGRDFEAALALYGTDSVESAYRILGLDPGAPEESIKRAYRRLAKEYHPDALEAKGVSAELRAFAQEKMVAVNQAYGRLREARGF